MCLCCHCLDAEREEEKDQQYIGDLVKAMQRIACAAGIEFTTPSEIADLVCTRLAKNKT